MRFFYSEDTASVVHLRKGKALGCEASEGYDYISRSE
jgi:hypothetical protein